ncbi:MAG: glutamate mutase L, partial [Phycisphaerales bacterium]
MSQPHAAKHSGDAHPAIDPSRISVILATDCGSTTTKAIMIERTAEGFRQTYRGEAPTTVEEPFADVTVGVTNSVSEIAELSGRRLVSDDGTIIRRTSSDDPNGCDIYISTSSAGGGLQMMVAGVVKQMTAESAKRAALGAGAIVMDTIAANDKRRPHEQIQRIRELRPDMVLISGGTDGGNTTQVVQLAELIAPAKPRPRFGGEYRLPIIFAGNKDARPSVEKVFEGPGFDLSVVENLRPTMEQENLGPARDRIHDVFLEHVMAHAPGYDKLMTWTDAPIMPTPGAVGDILQTIAKRQGINAVGVDIGGATTDVFSVFDGVFNRTVSANLGMSYSISNVCAEAGMDRILRWVHLDMDERELRNRVKNKMIRPTTIPQTLEALVFEQAVAREALRLAYQQHKEFATTLKGVQQQRTVGDVFSQQAGGQSLVDNMRLDLLVASGGVLSHAPRMSQTALMLVDAFEPEGFTSLAKDSIFMMPHLGVLAGVHEQAAMEVFERDCLIVLGACVAAKGEGKVGK